MKLLFLIVIVYLAYRMGKAWVQRGFQVRGPNRQEARPIDDVMIQDPVCGVHFARREGVALDHGGQTILFCSPECRDRFLAENQKGR